MKVDMREPSDLLLDDLELLLREIDEFNTAISNNKAINIPQSLENYLQFVAKSGNTVFPWTHVRNLIRTKMVNAIQQFQEPTCPNESFVLERFDLFRLAAPFTVQRLTELILQPTRHYRKKEKFLRGLEKTVLVVSTVEPHSLSTDDERNGNDTSSSSCEAETETVSFNRTITDVISQSITVTSESIISDNVTSSAASSVEVITPDQSKPVSSEAVIIDNLTDSKAVGLDSMEGVEAQDILPVQSSTIDVMDQSIVLDPVTSVVGAAAEVISQSISVTSDSIIPDSVTSSAVSSVEVITPDSDESITVSSESVILENLTDPKAIGLDSMESGEAPTIEVMDQSIVLDPVSSVVGAATEVISQSISVTSDSIIPDSVTSSAVSSVEVITPDSDQPIIVSSEGVQGVILENLTDPKPIVLDSMESGETQDILPVQSSTIDVMDQSAVLDPVSSVVGAAAEVISQSISVTSDNIISDSVTSSAVSSVEVITPDSDPNTASSEGAVLENLTDPKTIGLDSMASGEST